jgi:DNA-directed RNA polymerase specialized sigma24 family protein
MDFDKRSAILVGRMKGFAIKTGCRNDAEDLAQEAFANCFAKVRENLQYQKLAEEDSEWFEHYTFKALIRLIINLKKRRKILDTFDQEIRIDKKIKPEKELKYKEKLIDEKYMEEQKHTVMKNFILELRELLSDQEKQFLDVFLELAEESSKINISKAGRLLDLPPDKSHNMWKKIQNIANDLEAKKKPFEDVSAVRRSIGSAISSVLNEYFTGNPEDEITQDSMDLARKCLKNMSLADISLLSKILK